MTLVIYLATSSAVRLTQELNMQKSRHLVWILFVLSVASYCFSSSAPNVYLAQSAMGTGTGDTCANARPVSFFNTAANWGTGTSQIGPGTTVHLCGAFTGTAGQTLLTTRGSGTSSAPIKILFEAGAVLSAPYWGSASAGAINIGHSYIVLDGGSNGLLQNTANGSALANQQNSTGVLVGYTTSNVEVRNLTIRNIYVHSGSGSDGANTRGIFASGSNSNLSIHNNTISMVRQAILVAYSTSANVAIYNNTTSRHCWGIGVGAGNTTASLANLYVYGNKISDFAEWYDTANAFHADGIYIYGAAGGTTGITNAYIYSNFLGGDIGTHGTAFIYASNNVFNLSVFNNIIAASNNYPNDGLIYLLSNCPKASVHNNTLIGNGKGNAIYFGSASPGLTVANNIIKNVQIGIFQLDAASTIASAKNNVYYGVTYVGRAVSLYRSTLSLWQAACKCDTGSLVADPVLATDYSLSAKSPAIGAGANLTSLGVSLLQYDYLQGKRAASGNWDAGAIGYYVNDTLSVAVSSSAGKVTSTSAPIECGTACTVTLPRRTAVPLKAIAVSSKFVKWSGACTGTAASCTVQLNGSTSATAVF